ncbi:hypothetical protein [Bosea sp. TAF32]|uniref:hypothetical protein n=1 Tax=Bosea sp. TAF32 TaxID=3237482 RepID=UPI003F92052A
MTPSDIFDLGAKAERILRSDDFLDLVDHLSKELGNRILATALNETAEREEAYQTYNGLRYFSNSVQDLVLQRDKLLAGEELSGEPNQDDTDDPSGI